MMTVKIVDLSFQVSLEPSYREFPGLIRPSSVKINIIDLQKKDYSNGNKTVDSHVFLLFFPLFQRETE